LIEAKHDQKERVAGHDNCGEHQGQPPGIERKEWKPTQRGDDVHNFSSADLDQVTKELFFTRTRQGGLTSSTEDSAQFG
jgi:hypothetical protein